MKIRNHLEAMPPYIPIEPFEVLSARIGRDASQIIKLDANENPFQYLLAGSGADELIDLLMRLILEPGDCVLSCPPTFGMYSFDAELNAARVIEVPRDEDFSLDLDAICEAVKRHRPKILFVATPNNPDGSLLDTKVIDKLLELPLLVVLDEAYIEFAGEHLGAGLSRIRDVPARENLIVLRTFSKWAGLAGLRVGYGAFPLWLMPTLWKAKQPYNVNVAASVAAITSLQHIDQLTPVVELLRAERARLFSALQAIPYLKPSPSQSNFILCRIHGRDAAELKSRLAEEYGIFIRYFNKPGLSDHIRISVGRPQDTDVLLDALRLESKGS
jgi:histidinol-phosphate aminotransferase